MQPAVAAAAAAARPAVAARRRRFHAHRESGYRGRHPRHLRRRGRRRRHRRPAAGRPAGDITAPRAPLCRRRGAEDADASTATSADGRLRGGRDRRRRRPVAAAPSVPARDPSKPPEPDTPAVPLGIASSGAVLSPHPDKAEKGGEDACFVLRDQGAFGVMDGVGGWADEGVDPAAYSNTFAERSAAAVLMGASDPRGRFAPRTAREDRRVHHGVRGDFGRRERDRERRKPGRRRRDDRPGRKEDYFRTPSQQHDVQLPVPAGVRGSFTPRATGGGRRGDVFSAVRPGDALVMGSDGLWDNVPHAEVAQTVEACVRGGKDAQETAEAIATLGV